MTRFAKISTFSSLAVGAVFASYFLFATNESQAMSDKEAMKDSSLSVATFAGGCFWCMETAFENEKGVSAVISGFTGGHVKNPTYEQVSTGSTGHLESVQVYFDPKQTSYETLLDTYWHQIDPTDEFGAFVDRGDEYRPAIFYHDEKQKLAAQASKVAMEKSGVFSKPIVVQILPLKEFYPAEDYHQNFFEKSPMRYKSYRSHSGRDQFLEKTWGKDQMKTKPAQDKVMMNFTKPSAAELKARLSPLQYKVTQENGTERAFDNEYWDNKHDGLYVDIVSGEPLFSSKDKYDSKSGWPSFTKPLDGVTIIEKEDRGFFMTRTEVRSKFADSHLGHVFDDGPAPTGLRYCINSAALRFVPKDELANNGLEKYAGLFK